MYLSEEAVSQAGFQGKTIKMEGNPLLTLA
jgi:hypothetical protein